MRKETETSPAFRKKHAVATAAKNEPRVDDKPVFFDATCHEGEKSRDETPLCMIGAEAAEC
jgi:hypothetical protein